MLHAGLLGLIFGIRAVAFVLERVRREHDKEPEVEQSTAQMTFKRCKAI